MTPSALAVLALLLAPRARAAEDWETHLARAELFARKRWTEDAMEEVEAALAAPGGTASFEVHWLAAELAWELLDVEAAMRHAAAAARLAPDEERRRAARELADYYAQGFGFLVVDAPHEGMATRMQLDIDSVLYDPELRRYVDRLALRLRERTPLPARVALPVGRYRVNGQSAEVRAGETTELELPMSAIGARGLAALQVLRAEASAGLAVLAGSWAADLAPGPAVELALTQPVGPLLVGGVGELFALGTPPSLAGAGPQPGWSAGLRVGVEPPFPLPLAVRPSLLVRRIHFEGLAWDCLPGAGCAAPQEAGPGAERTRAAVDGTAVGAELSVDYRRAGRTTATGMGIKLAGGAVSGAFPEDAARVPAGRWVLLDLRLLAHLSYAF